MTRLKKVLLPIRWSPVTVSLTAGTATSVNIAQYLQNPRRLAVTYTVVGTLPTGASLSSAGLLSFNGALNATTTSVQFRATAGSHVAESAVTAVTVAPPPLVNTAPVWSSAPTAASLGPSGGTIQFVAVDPQGDTVTYGLSARYRTDISIDPATGLVTVPASAAGTNGDITVTASDGSLSATPVTCAVTVGVASDYTRVGTIAENAWETGSIAPAADKIDGVWASATRDVGYVNSTSYISTTGGGFGPSTDYDIRVVSSYRAPTTPNGPGEMVYPRAGGYFLMTKIHKDKDYRGVNNADEIATPNKYFLLDDGTLWYQATPPAGRSWQYDKPRVQCNMIQDIKRWFWDEYAWCGFSIYLPANLEYDLGVADHRSGNSLFTVSPNVYQTEASFLTLQYRRPSSSINVAHWMVDLITGLCELETDPAAVNSTHDLGSIADDRGRWTDFVFRWRFNPYTVASTYRGFSFTANGGSLEVWKSTGAPSGPNNDRVMTKVLTRRSQPIGMLPGSSTDSIRLSGLRQYKYSWKRAATNSTVVGPIMIGYDQAYIGRETLGAGFRDVHPTKMVQP